MSCEKPDSGSGAVRPLFEIPEYDWAFYKFVKHAMDALIIAKSPLLSRISVEPSPGITTSRNTMPSGEIVENPPILTQLPFPVDVADAVAGRLDAIVTAIDAAAEVGLNSIIPKVLDYSARLSTAAGTATDWHGEPLNHKMIIKSLENVDLDFNTEDQLDMSSMFIVIGDDPRNGITFDELIAKLPPRTQAEGEEWNRLVERKRKEFNDRRRHRHLS
jgi:hypothetical protein